jgi:hypothetical protein
MKLDWMLLVTIVTASLVCHNFATVIPDADAISFKKDHLVVIASEVNVA